MSNLLETDVVLSDLGTRVFAVSANMDFDTEPKAVTDAVELYDVLSIDNLGYDRNSEEYRPLANGGFPKKAVLGYNQEDLQIELVRSEQGAYNEQSTYWFLNNKLEQYKVSKAFFGIIVVRPVYSISEDEAYEARYYTVFCSGIEDSANSESGREYTATLSRSGPPIDLLVTVEGDTFKYARKA